MLEANTRLQRGLEHLERLIASVDSGVHPGDRNEAATRFDIVDALLLDVLGWPRDQVRPEEHSRSGFADYLLGRPRQLVVEAKREGDTFWLPPETPTIAPLATLFRLDSHLSDTVEQARRYAYDFSLPYAAVTNGHQLVAFLANRIDGVEPLTGKALAFPSLAAMRDNFAAAWDGLSRPGVESRRLSAILAGDTAPAPPAKASTLLANYPGQAQTDPLIADLTILGELFLIDLADHPSVSEDFLRNCYLSSGALSQHASVGRRILKARYDDSLSRDLEVDISPARTRRGVPPELMSDVASASLSARPIVLLGFVGVGKTIFIRHLVRVDAKRELRGAIVLSVDLLREPALEDLRPFIADRLIQELRDSYDVQLFANSFAEQVYARELADFTDSPWGQLRDEQPAEYAGKRAEHLTALMADREAHLRRSLSHLARSGRQIVTILDNVDHRPFEIQEEVFVIAEAMAKSWTGTVFVALRPDTFNRSKRAGALSAYQPRVFAVSPPRLDRVLEKRILFAQRQIRRGGADFPQLTALANAESLDAYLEVLRLSLKRSQALARLVDNVAGQNARRALDLLTTVLGSSHARPTYALAQQRKHGNYSVPFHQFLKAVMLGDREHYDPSASQVPNLFDISTTDGREHFLLPVLVGLLHGTSDSAASQGFAPASFVYDECQQLGFRPEQITWQLERAIASSVIEARPLEGTPELLRATSLGVYVSSGLVDQFTYIDEVSIDTPILDSTTRAVTHPVEQLSERIPRTEGVVRYLDAAWDQVKGRGTLFDWEPHSVALKRASSELEARLERAPSRTLVGHSRGGR